MDLLINRKKDSNVISDSLNTEIHNTNNVSEAKLWEEFKQGKEEALVYLYKTYSERLFRFARQFLNREASKDVVHELFLTLIRRRRSLSDVNSIPSYLYKATYRIIKTKFDKKIICSVDIETNQSLIGVHLSVENKIIDEEIVRSRLNKLRIGLQKLTDKQHEVLLLYYYEGFTYSEIAEILQSNKESVRKLVYRAIDRLKTFV